MQQAIFIRHNGKFTRLNLSDIIYVEALRNYIKIYGRDRHFLVLMSLKKMMELLPANAFHRIHKSYIISLDHLSEFNYEKAWLGKICLPMGDHYGKSLPQKLNILGELTEEQAQEKPIIPLAQTDNFTTREALGW